MANLLKEIPSSKPSASGVDGTRDSLTQLRIGNRLIGKDVIELQMKGRTFIRLSNLSSSDASRFDFAEENWVTAGVIHKMVDSRTQSGRSVSYLQLTDLKDNYINVFLHGERGEYVSFPVGGLVYLINPDIVPSKDGRDHVALSVPSSRHIQFIGQAMDYGICCSLQRNGQKCPNAVNKEVSRYCMYHVRKTQETINAMRGDLSSSLLSTNYEPHRLSDGRFQVGKDSIDCRSAQSKRFVDLNAFSGVAPSHMQVINGVRVGGSIGNRLHAQLVEMERQQKKEQERTSLLKRQREMESKENLSKPFLGRDLLPGKILRLESDEDDHEKKRMEKIYAVRAKLAEINSCPQPTKSSLTCSYPSPRYVRDVSSPSPTKEDSILKACEAVPVSTGNAAFDSILKATSGENLEATRKQLMSTKGVYADQALRDRVRILQDRQELQERREEARQNMMSLEVACFWCSNCHCYVENGLGRKYCEDHGHYLERRHATKRMFECMTCHTRKGFIGTEMPVSKCSCGGCVWSPCTFYKEKSSKGPELVITPQSDHVLYGFDIKQKADWIVC